MKRSSIFAKVLDGIGISLVIASFISIVFGHSGFGLRLATYTFGFFVIGLISYLLELTRNER